MARVPRRRPFSDLMNIRDDMDRVFGDALRLFDEGYGESLVGGPPIDLEETEEEYILSAEIPGIKKEDVNISISNNQVVLSGEIFEEKDEQQANYHLKERTRGRFSRSFTLPSAVDSENAEATYKDGILTLRIPKAEEARPKQIPIKEDE